jgi:nucleotide-binding universal stress UspA family protein
MVGYDGSEAARRALDRAAELAGYGSTITVVNVALPLYRHTFSAMPDVDAVKSGERILDDARTYLAEHHVQANTVELVGEPAETLIETATREDADILVVGRRSREGLGRLRLGSVSAKVVRGAHCDVLVVR